ncbi:MAG: hypothetical protein HY271_05090 [Deltaproteobacteria bacterium]|nr:hypothetical protein [Deltaproteobacteria bacterium]
MINHPSMRRRLGIINDVIALVNIVVLLAMRASTICAAATDEIPRFEGHGKCDRPMCHGAEIAAPLRQQTWLHGGASQVEGSLARSAHTRWRNRIFDRHSEAYRTLTHSEGETIGGHMGIDPTTSAKCLRCHAPPATADPAGSHRVEDGVSCEHCHGPSEFWLGAHFQRDWASKRGQYLTRWFHDLWDFVARAETCASCHVTIDHEIVAAGHPALQSEIVAYSAVMKHWNDLDRLPTGTFSPDPSLWAIGQIVGLRITVKMISQRAGRTDFQAIGDYSHFTDKQCYQCHHKLIEDAVRQALGHYEMVDIITQIVFPESRGELDRLWTDLTTALPDSADETQRQSERLEQWLVPQERRLSEHVLDQVTTRRLLDRITSSGNRLKTIELNDHTSLIDKSSVTRIDNIGEPWWYTTGPPEQTIMAIEALCEPAFPGRCAAGPGGIEPELREILNAVDDRLHYRPDQFGNALNSIRAKLFH